MTQRASPAWATRSGSTRRSCSPAAMRGERGPPRDDTDRRLRNRRRRALRSASARGLHPGHELVGIARCERGEVDVAIAFDPRPDYGRRKAPIRAMGKLGLRVDCGGDAILSLLTDAALGADGRGRVRLRGGEETHFSVTYACGAPAVLPPPTRDRSAAALERALQPGPEWASR